MTLFAVALSGEEIYWLCQPINERRLVPEWKNCMCQWLYPVEDADIRSHLPWYEDHLGVVLELSAGETSRIERFAVISDSVKAKKFVVGGGHAPKTYFLLEKEERDILNVKFGELLKGELCVETSKVPPVRTDEKSGEEKQHVVVSHVPNGSNGGQGGGNSEVFSWNVFYILEYGNRVFYVCSAPHGNKVGFKVERLTRKGVTIFLLFQDEDSGPCRVGATQEGERVTESCVLEGGGGRVMVFMTGKREIEVGGSKRRNCGENFVSEPLSKVPRRESARETSLSQQRHLKAAGVNLWVDCDEKCEEVANLAKLFPFSSEGGSSVHTTVFPDGTCVSYDSATAAKFASKKKAVATSTDCDMAALLENIQLAKEQFNAM